MLARVVDIRCWLESDRDTPFAARLARDRAIGRSLPAGDDCARILGWWQMLQASIATESTAAPASLPGARVVRLLWATLASLIAIGVLLGAGAAAVAFAYDGTHPVNLFHLFGILVVLPGILLLAPILVLVMRGPPGRLAPLNVGRWVGVLIDRLGGVELFGPGAGAPLGLARFARWQLAALSQWAAMGFFAGVICYALLLISFSDLALGWSTTLDLSTTVVHGFFSGLAAPWSGWLPQAVPDLALTEASRYFRGEWLAAEQGLARPLGAWWPYVLMVVLVYGWLPRIVLLGIAEWRLGCATRALLCEDPEAVALLDRLGAPLVATGADSPEPEPRDEFADQAVEAQIAPPPVTGDALVIIWNDAIAWTGAQGWLATCLSLRARATLATGVLERAVDQAAAVEQFFETWREAAADARIVVFTRGWEPPLLEFIDFLALLRRAAGGLPSIVIVPVDPTGTRVEPADHAVWATTLARHKDARLYVQPPVAFGERVP